MSHTANRPARTPELSCRTLPTAATVGNGAGIVETSVPFVASMAPGERARALGAPAEVNFKAIKPAEFLTVEWRGKPIWVLHRTSEMNEAVRAHAKQLSDPRRTSPLLRRVARL